MGDCEDAELVFFVKGLPTEGHQKWMAPLLRSVKATLSLNFPSDLLASMDCTDDSVRMDVKGGLVVNVRFSPAFENYVETVQALGMLGPYARKPFRAELREGADAVRGEAAWAREGDDAADEVWRDQ